MADNSDTPLQSIDRAMLTPLVRRAMGSETVEVISWQPQRIYGGAGAASEGIFRLSGTALDQDETLPWSLILKLIHLYPDSPGVSDPSSWIYWKREVLAYQSGLLQDLPGGVAAPRCFDIVNQPNGDIWLWLEDARDDLGPQWPLEHYGVVARHLGQFNGAYLMGRPIPSRSWLSKGWLRQRVARAAPGLAQLRHSLEHPLVRRVFPPDVARGLFRLWDQREAFLKTLDGLPQTFCHIEAHRRNLFARRVDAGEYQTVLIDWAYVGTGAVGQEIAPLVEESLAFFDVEIEHVRELDGTVFHGYLQGMREAGWRGDPRTLRFGYAAASALHFARGLGLVVSILPDESRHAWVEQLLGRSMEQYVDRAAEYYRFLLGLADEARSLMDSLP